LHNFCSTYQCLKSFCVWHYINSLIAFIQANFTQTILRLIFDANIAQNTIFTAKFAYFPLKRRREARGMPLDVHFGVSGNAGAIHRNDTNAAGGSAAATAVQYVSAAAVFAALFPSRLSTVNNMRHPLNSTTPTLF
jgi:hypothetical protein